MDIFDVGDFQQRLKSECMGKKVIYTDVTGSTMDDARKCGVNDPAQYPHGTIFIAERQTKARGARDHKWDASNTGNIYATMILHMPQSYKTFEGRFELEVAACMAVYGVVRRFGVKVVPKWPNDLWLRGHKLAGFLIEDGRFDIPGSNLCLIILGMGINVNADIRRNAALYSIAASLMCERNGRRVCREEFLSDICLALEETLVSRANNLLKYRTDNLFQKGCHISVTCASENRVIDGEFLGVCDNWDVTFRDKRTGETLRGRSDYFTVRPKVSRKILVVYAGLTASNSALTVASRLTAIVDISKWVVCAVPETALTQTDEWMKSCDLLVLPDDVCDSVRMTSKLTQYLKKGGNLLTTGLASYFTAKIFEIPFKEGLLQSLGSDTNISVISVEYEGEVDKTTTEEEGGGDHKEGQNESGGTKSSASSTHVIFPTSLVYFRFSQDYTLKEASAASTLSASPGPKGDNSSSASSETEKVSSSSSDGSSLAAGSSTIQSSKAGRKNVSLRYHSVSEEKEECCIAVMLKATNYGGSIAVFGFDLGHDSLPPFHSSSASSSSGDKKGNENTTRSGSAEEYDEHIKDVNADRFKRDILIYRVLGMLNIT